VAVGCIVAVAVGIGAGACVHELRKTINAAAIRILFIPIPLEWFIFTWLIIVGFFFEQGTT
jgi:hypothetical protein